MGVDYYANAAIGMKIDPARLRNNPTKVKAFEHNYSEEFDFDHKSGKKLWTMERAPIPEFDEDKVTLAGYPLVYTTDNRDCVVAVASSGTGSSRRGNDDMGMGSLPSQADIEAFTNKMKSLGIWNQQDFGLWSVLYCSY